MKKTLLKCAATAVLGTAAVVLALVQGTLGRDGLAVAAVSMDSLSFRSVLQAPAGARWSSAAIDAAGRRPFREGRTRLAPEALIAEFARQLRERGYLPLQRVERGDPRVVAALLQRGGYLESHGAGTAAIAYVDPAGRSAAAVAWCGEHGRGSRYIIGGLEAGDGGAARDFTSEGERRLQELLAATDR